jgi:hypothetical protein
MKKDIRNYNKDHPRFAVGGVVPTPAPQDPDQDESQDLGRMLPQSKESPLTDIAAPPVSDPIARAPDTLGKRSHKKVDI